MQDNSEMSKTLIYIRSLLVLLLCVNIKMIDDMRYKYIVSANVARKDL